MFLARVKKVVTATEKHSAYLGKKLYIVRPVTPDGRETGEEWGAIDYIGSGIGDLVVCGGAPGAAKDVFKIDFAPIRTLIVAIVDTVDYRDLNDFKVRPMV